MSEHFMQPLITRTCRVLRAELLPLYCQTRVFSYAFELSESDELGRWVKAIGPDNRGLVRGLDVTESLPWSREISQPTLAARMRLE